MGATRPASGKIMHVSYDDWHVPTRDASPPFKLALCAGDLLALCAGDLLALCAGDLLAFCAGVLLEMPRHGTHHPQPCSQELLFNLITL